MEVIKTATIEEKEVLVPIYMKFVNINLIRHMMLTPISVRIQVNFKYQISDWAPEAIHIMSICCEFPSSQLFPPHNAIFSKQYLQTVCSTKTSCENGELIRFLTE